MPEITSPQFSGVLGAIQPVNEWEKPQQVEIENDVEGERETLPMAPGDLSSEDIEKLPAGADVSQLQASLLDASKGVTDGTDAEYRRFGSPSNSELGMHGHLLLYLAS